VGATLLPTLLLAAGCSSGTKTPTASPASPQTSATAASPSPSPSASEPQSANGSGGLSQAEFVAAVKKAIASKRSAHMEMQMSTTQGVISAQGEVSYAGKQSAMAMTMTIPGLSSGKVEMRVVDGIIYMAMPPMTPAGKFLKIDPNAKSGPFAGQFGGLGDQLDPRRSVDAFGTGLKKLEYVGNESVDGEDMDHYVLTVDSSAGLKALGQQVPSGVPKTMTYDLWLDSHNLMRRMKMDLSGLSMDSRMSQWGEPVHIVAPPRAAQMMAPGTTG